MKESQSIDFDDQKQKLINSLVVIDMQERIKALEDDNYQLKDEVRKLTDSNVNYKKQLRMYRKIISEHGNRKNHIRNLDSTNASRSEENMPTIVNSNTPLNQTKNRGKITITSKLMGRLNISAGKAGFRSAHGQDRSIESNLSN